MIEKYTDGSNTVEATQYTGQLSLIQKIWLGRHLVQSHNGHGFLRVKCELTRLSAKYQEAIAQDWLVKIDDVNLIVLHRRSLMRNMFTI